ncbi:putative Asp/Glu racemase [Mycena pura]|uniref:Asp/Glu racemase n=1 Tax=Mycena pura TaxID=153505 RepID=A0AAD6YD32_9AGAR|nr:putative Asp/Glu racemase [Mycena pura]
MSTKLKSLRLGILVPSLNTALEPVTSAIISQLSPNVTVHFSRFPVTKISLEPSALLQFDSYGPIMAAARLLADAHVDVIGWSGTSGGWLGFDEDERFCQAIKDELGVPATTSTLALNRALDLLEIKKFALVTPEKILDRQVKEVMEKGKGEVGAISTFCTNLTAAQRASKWEEEYGVPVLDTVSTVIWDMLRVKEYKKGAVKGWGKLFEL